MNLTSLAIQDNFHTHLLKQCQIYDTDVDLESSKAIAVAPFICSGK